MKIIYYCLLPAILYGMHTNKASAQTTSIDWGYEASGITILANSSSSTDNKSTVYGNVVTTDSNLPNNVTVKNGTFNKITPDHLNNYFNPVIDQLERATSSNTVELTPSSESWTAGIALLGHYYNNNNNYYGYYRYFNLNRDNTTDLLKPGIYTYPGDVEIPLGQTLVLDDGGDKNAVFIFRIGGNFRSVGDLRMLSGFTGANVFFEVNGTAAISGKFTGNILSKSTSDFSLKNAGNITGRVYSLGKVIFDNSVIDVPNDTDGDGVPDINDDYPNDPTKAYNNDSKLNPQTIAFEDMWPHKGDFDFNDLVMKTSYNFITNAHNAVVQVVSTFTLLATGGIQKNSFHIRFITNKIDPYQFFWETSGNFEYRVDGGISFKIFDDMREQMVEWNTIPGKPISPAYTYKLTFNVNPENNCMVSDIIVDPYIVNGPNGNNEREIHLPGMSPTNLANGSLFNTYDDNSAIQTYTTKEGLPWAISFPSDHFDYPVEGKDINTAYLKLRDWVKYNSVSNNDWYSNTDLGFRNNDLVFVTAK